MEDKYEYLFDDMFDDTKSIDPKTHLNSRKRRNPANYAYHMQREFRDLREQQEYKKKSLERNLP